MFTSSIQSPLTSPFVSTSLMRMGIEPPVLGAEQLLAPAGVEAAPSVAAAVAAKEPVPSGQRPQVVAKLDAQVEVSTDTAPSLRVIVSPAATTPERLEPKVTSAKPPAGLLVPAEPATVVFTAEIVSALAAPSLRANPLTLAARSARVDQFHYTVSEIDLVDLDGQVDRVCAGV